MARRCAFLASLLLVGLAACGETDPVAPGRALIPRAAPLAPASAIWDRQLTGGTPSGSLYSINVPLNWNGRLVVYAHGFVDAALPVALPNIDALRDAMGAAGFAVAYSSFSSNGYNVVDGMQRTHQLRALFVEKIGKPTSTYVIGHSLGGLITLLLAERFPTVYAGALPMCGVVGGTRRELQYIGDVRVLFDYLYPGVLPGNVGALPPITDLAGQILVPAQTAMVGNPNNAFVLANVAQTPVPGATPTEVITSIVTAVGFHARGLGDLVSRAGGLAPYGNKTVKYASTPFNGLMPALNAGVGRYALVNGTEQWMLDNGEPSGALSIPVITLHTTRDPVVPVFHEGLLANKAASTGSSANLLQRSVDRFGHCSFTGPEMLTALGDLVTWAETGVKPIS